MVGFLQFMMFTTCGVAALDIQTPSVPFSLAESANVLVIKGPADLTAKLSQVEKLLYQGDQGKDNPLKELLPATIAFMPSATTYNFSQLQMGYYTSMLGLGEKPDDITLAGNIDVQNSIQSIDNVFYKSLENLKIQGNLNWLTSQACPVRHVHITGDFSVGGGCGGVLTDSVVGGAIQDGGQQQYLFRNVTAAQVTGRQAGQMNFVFVDSNVATDSSNDLCAGVSTCGSYYPTKQNPAPNVDVDTMSVPRLKSIGSKKKPLITAKGVLIRGKLHTKVLQVKDQKDFDAMVKGKLASGTTVLLHPNVYDVTEPLTLAGNSISVIGLGFPILRSKLSKSTIQVSGANCIVASVIVDAPLLTFDQDVMIKVDGAGVEMYDVFGRTFLAWTSPVQKYKTNTMLQISGAKGFMEDVWLWRGDHWSGPDLEDKSFGQMQWDPYNVNPYGLVVTEQAVGVTALGAFVEHQLWNPIYWNGDDGVLIMSQGEAAYTNNGNTDPSVGGSTAVPIKGLTPGVYYSIGANVTKHKFVGGGIYNVFGENFYHQDYSAMEVLTEITPQIDVSKVDVAAWVDTEHFAAMLLYKGQKYGPGISGAQGAFYFCNITKMVAKAPPAPPPPPACAGLTCTLSNTDYFGNVPGFPVGTQKQKYAQGMTAGDCCQLCTSDPTCAYWKFGNNNCFYYASNVTRDQWKSFSKSPPKSQWDMGLKDNACCTCPSSSGGNACGPTPSRSPFASEKTIVI
jgi:hypothetical protein